MLKTNIKRILRAGLTNFWRNGVVTLASVLTLTVTLFVFGSIILGSAFLDSTLSSIQEKVDISVSFKTDALESEVVSIKESLLLLPEVESVEYVSREQELSAFRERHKNNALIIQSLNEVDNPFGARLNVRATDPSQYENISKFIETKGKSASGGTIIDQISFKKDVVNKLLAIIASSRKVSVAVGILLMLMSILVTVNTISLAIYISRDEISLMRLVGADNLYVRGPFVVEGIIAGMIASFISLILLYPSTIWVKNATSSVYGGINLVSYYVENFAQIFLILLLSGIVLGAISSYLAIRKYVKV